MEQNGVEPTSETSENSLNDIVTVCLRKSEGIPKLFFYDPSILITKSKYFADKLSVQEKSSYIRIQCLDSDYQHHIDLLNVLHLPESLLLDSWSSVDSALGILQVAITLECKEISTSCIQFLEAVPWDVKEEEEILKIVPKLGPIAMPILARVQPVDVNAAKTVFLSAVRFATSISESVDEVKVSAQDQVEYMLDEDGDTALITADDEVKSVVKKGISGICSSFQTDLTSLISESPDSITEMKILQMLADFQWLCNVLPKMELMGDLVSKWDQMSNHIINIISNSKLDSSLWATKLKLIELTSKILEAVGYGTVILPSSCRSNLVKEWIPYMRRMKPVLDSICDEKTGTYPHRIEEETCRGIEGAVIPLVLALPSSDQAEILADWMENNLIFGFPDLSEAFEIWCYRTKSSKRRLTPESLDDNSSSATPRSNLSV